MSPSPRSQSSGRAYGPAPGLVAAGAAAVAGLALAASLPVSPARAGDEQKPAKADVGTMDVDLLRENLLKIWIIEESSSRHNQSRIAQKSFEGLTGPVTTGDAELDARNVEARKKLQKELRHYLLLELDGAIEAVDICDRVLGKKVTLDEVTLERRLFFGQKLGAISWRNVLLQEALQDLSKSIGTPVDFPVLPKNLTLEVTFEAPAGFSLEGILDFLKEQHPLEWKYEGGRLDVRYTGEIPTGRERR